jgi:hypothetical protein
VLALALASQAQAGSRSGRSDNPGNYCDLQGWVPTGVSSKWTGKAPFVSGIETIKTDTSGLATKPNSDQGVDPYLMWDGGPASAKSFFQSGTVVVGDPVVYCVPNSSLSFVWNNDPEAGTQNPNPASQADPTLAATGAVMYEWVDLNPNNETFTVNMPDAEVIVWSIPANTGSGSSIKWPGGFEFELDWWCGNTLTGAAASGETPSITWMGNSYTYTDGCSSFNGDDLLFNDSGVLVGYVDNPTSGTPTVTLGTSAPGWTESLRTTTHLAISKKTAPQNTPVKFTAAVWGPFPAGGAPGGSVEFLNGSTSLGTAALNNAGVASLSLDTLTPGTYEVTADYVSNDARHANSDSGQAITLTVTN